MPQVESPRASSSVAFEEIVRRPSRDFTPRRREALGKLLREAVFIGPGSGNPRAFNPSDPATSGLQELLMLYPGYLMPAETPGFTFDP